MIIPNERYVQVEKNKRKIGEDKQGNPIWQKEANNICIDCALENNMILPSDLKNS